MKNEYQINEDWKITTDSRQFILQYRTIPQKGNFKGQEVWVIDGYFPSIGQIFSKVAQYAVMENLGDMKVAFEKIAMLEKRLDELTKLKIKI
jgi:hypothetical protein